MGLKDEWTVNPATVLRKIKSDQNGIESYGCEVYAPAGVQVIKSDQNGIESRYTTKWVSTTFMR